MAKKAAEPVEGEEVQEAIILSPEVEEKINTEITVIRDKGNVTEQLIKKLAEEYGGMTINGQEDKEGYLNLQTARKHVKAIRVGAAKLFDEGREPYVVAAARWLENKKKVVDALKAIEDPLYAQEKAYDVENDRLKAERKALIEQQGIARMSDLIKFGASLQGLNWVLGDIVYEAQLVKEADPEIYEGIRGEFEAFYNEKEAVRVEIERVQKESEEKLRQQQEQFQKQQEDFQRQQQEFQKQQQEARIKSRAAFLEGLGMGKNSAGHYVYADQLVTMADLAEKQDDEWQGIAEQSKAAIDRIRQQAKEQDRVREVFATRLPQLKEWSTSGHYVYGKGKQWGEVSDIVNMPDPEFHELVKENDAYIRERDLQKERERQQELKDSADQSTGISRLKALRELESVHDGTALEVGRLTEEEWAPIFLKAKFANDQKLERERIQRESEQKERERLENEKKLQEAGDKAKYADTLKYLLSTPIHEMRSSQYRTKMRVIRDFIDSLK